MPSLPSLFARARGLVGRREVALIVLLATLAGGVSGFIKLASEVSEGETATIDERILLAFREPGDSRDPVGSRSVESAMRACSTVSTIGTTIPHAPASSTRLM